MALRWTIAAVVLILPLKDAVACKCSDRDASRIMATSAVVFEGRPAARHATQLPLYKESDDTTVFVPGWSYEFVVDRQWRGDVRPRHHVAVTYGSGVCERRFRLGEPAMVAANLAEDGQLETSSCSALKLDDAKLLAAPVYPGGSYPSPLLRGGQSDWPSNVPEIDPRHSHAAHPRHAAHTLRDVSLIGGGFALALFLALPRRGTKIRAASATAGAARTSDRGA